MSTCEHTWQFQQNVWWDAKNENLPGTSALPRYLADRFYCTKCLEQKVIRQRCIGNSYHTKPDGAVPL